MVSSMHRGVVAVGIIACVVFAGRSGIFAQEAKKADGAAAAGAADNTGKQLSDWVNKFSLGGQARFRYEIRDPQSYTGAAGTTHDDDFVLSRLRLNINVNVDEHIKVFLQPQDSRAFGEEASVVADEEQLDLHQGYVDLIGLVTLAAPVDIRVGRQELSYGDQRLVSPLDWNNVARSWDGIRLTHNHHDIKADLFYTIVNEAGPADGGTADAGDDDNFGGLYLSYSGVKDYVFDVYGFLRRFSDEAAVVRDNDSEFTIGTRFKGEKSGFDYSAELAYQWGEWVESDIKAWAAALTFGYTFKEASWKPRLGVEYTFATGDDNPADDDVETFMPLYPFGHGYQGYADQFSWMNGSDIRLTGSVKPNEKWTLQLDFHIFQLDEESDAWYNAATGVIRTDATGTAGDDVGNEVDLSAKYVYNEHLNFWMGYSRFFAGDYVDDTQGAGTDEDMDWFFIQMTVGF